MADQDSGTEPVVWMGIDIAKSWNAALVEHPDGRRQRFRFQHCRIAFEPTGDYHRPLGYRLLREGFDVCQISSVAGARYRDAMFNSWDKNDPKDAEVILRLLKQGDLPAAMDAAVRAHAGALFVMPDDPLMLNIRARLVEIAARNQMPDFHWAREFVELGGLMSYGENLRSSYMAAAAYMDKIKKGANPAMLPVEQPNRFELVINLKTAKALGITIPQAVLLRADEVVQ